MGTPRARALLPVSATKGGFAPDLPTNRDALDLIATGEDKAGYSLGRDVVLALDVAATEFFSDGAYTFEKSRRSAEQMADYYAHLLGSYRWCPCGHRDHPVRRRPGTCPPTTPRTHLSRLPLSQLQGRRGEPTVRHPRGALRRSGDPPRPGRRDRGWCAHRAGARRGAARVPYRRAGRERARHPRRHRAQPRLTRHRPPRALVRCTPVAYTAACDATKDAFVVLEEAKASFVASHAPRRAPSWQGAFVAGRLGGRAEVQCSVRGLWQMPAGAGRWAAAAYAESSSAITASLSRTRREGIVCRNAIPWAVYRAFRSSVRA